MVCITKVARNNSARACRNAPPLGGRHDYAVASLSARNKVNLAQRMLKISHQQAIALGAQHPARIGFRTAALFESLLAMHLILLRRILRVRFLLVFRAFHAGASYFY